MRFKKGCEVEILKENGTLLGFWQCAYIVCGNGHNYTVGYNRYSGTRNCENVDRVSRKFIRPCPPHVDLPENLIPGDVVEIFHDCSWKTATVCKVLGERYCVVRFVGYLQELVACRSELRVRQLWKNNEWIVMGKAIQISENEKHKNQSCLKRDQILHCHVEKTDTKRKLRIRNGYITVENKVPFHAPHISLKRGLSCYSQDEAYKGTTKKFRMSKIESQNEVLAPKPFCLPVKVDIASSREILGEKFIHPSSKNNKLGLSEKDVLQERRNYDVGCSNRDPNDPDDVSSSVGSCSITRSSPYKLQCSFYTGPTEANEDHSSDAESCFQFRHEEKNVHPSQEELDEEIHRLELHAYRSTMEVLHASGPLSWEQESLVTNLRISLHISNDEHLMELKSLISTAKKSVPIS